MIRDPVVSTCVDNVTSSTYIKTYKYMHLTYLAFHRGVCFSNPSLTLLSQALQRFPPHMRCILHFSFLLVILQRVWLRLCEHFGVRAYVQLSALEVCIVVVVQQSCGLLIQRRVREGLNKKRSNRLEELQKCQLGVPIALERVDTHSASALVDVWVKYWRDKLRSRRRVREVVWQKEPEFKNAFVERCAFCAQSKQFECLHPQQSSEGEVGKDLRPIDWSEPGP